MWGRMKEFGKAVLRTLGLIKHLDKVENHKKVNVQPEEYNQIYLNKAIYQGEVKQWHDLRYRGSKGNWIERKQMSLQMGKVLAHRFASLVFNEGVQISVDESKRAEWEKIEDVFNSAKFKREFQRYLEYCFAMGGVAVEVYMDGDQPKLAFATADAFFPLSQDTENVDEAVIANQFTKDGKVYTLLKWHEWGDDGKYYITNELYESGNHDTLGDKVSLSLMFPDMAPVTVLDVGSKMFVYIKPNTANNRFITSPLGLSVFDNVHDTLQMLDVMYDFWYNEFRFGKRRVAVPEYLVQVGYDINGRPYNYLDDSEELFVAMNSGELEGMEIKDLTVELRSEDVIHSIQSLLDVLSMQVGLSAGTFTFSESGMKTATQVVSEESETFRTRASHLSTIEDALRDLVVAVHAAASLENPSGVAIEREDVSIDFNDGVFIDRQSELDFYTTAFNAGLTSRFRAVKAIFKLTDEQAEELVQDIIKEEAEANRQTQEVMSDLLLSGVPEYERSADDEQGSGRDHNRDDQGA